MSIGVGLSKIRILRLIARMNVGGPAIQITGLMRHLPVDVFEQSLVTGFCENNELDYLEVNQIDLGRNRIKGFGRSINLLSDLKVLFAIMKQIKSFDPDIIHTHTAKAGFLGRIASILTLNRHIRVQTFHGHLLHGYFGKFKTWLVILVERVLARFTDRLVAVGNQVRDELLAVKIGNFDTYQVIGPGLEIKNLPNRLSSLKLFGLPMDKFIVTWIGRAVPVKAPHRILEIANSCQERGLRIQFVVVGDGPLLSDLKNSAKQMNLPITFLGWQSEIERVLSFSDMVLLTSENEGTPVALIQAQMVGIPVLATDVGSASEVILDGKSGFCIGYSVRDFVDKIELLSMNADMRESFGATGKSYALCNFSVKRLVSDHSALYRSLINQSKT